ncbi:MAG: delta-60 repeat domain-containing protein [Flavobacteriales bacterium]|nr:delta-60 repeat domain-containing protein [Flavobacteriales bacterium]
MVQIRNFALGQWRRRLDTHPLTASDGRIVVGGSFTSYNGVNACRIARPHSDGVLDQSFSVSSGRTMK